MDAAGREVGHAVVATPFVTDGGRVEMEVDALLGALAAVLPELGGRRRRVAAVGIAGVAESGAPLDAAGRALAPIMAWHDSRARRRSPSWSGGSAKTWRCGPARRRTPR